MVTALGLSDLLLQTVVPMDSPYLQQRQRVQLADLMVDTVDFLGLSMAASILACTQQPFPTFKLTHHLRRLPT